METVLIFVLIFGLFAWGMFKLLRFTRNTVGENSPLKVRRVYRISESKYFLSFDSLFVYFLAYFTLHWIYIVAFVLPTSTIADGVSLWPIYGISGLLLLLLSSLAWYGLSLTFNYWKYTKNVSLCFDPETKTLRVTSDNGEQLIRDGDIESVEIVSNQNHKFYYGYYKFRLADGNELILTEKTPGVWAIFEYFKELPRVYHKRRFPIIR